MLDPFNEKGGQTLYDIDRQSVVVLVQGANNFERWAHELKHAYQFELGEMSFGPSGRMGGYLYDLIDEYDAYNRSALFNNEIYSMEKLGTVYPSIAKKTTQIGLKTPFDIMSTYEDQLSLSTTS